MLKKVFIKAKNNHLIKSSAIFFSGSILASVCAYLYHLFMGRMLSVVGYGELQSLLSIFMIITMPSAALSLVVTQYSSHYHNPEELYKVKVLLKFLTKKFTYLGLIIFLILVLLSRQVSDFLQIQDNLKVIIISVIFIFIFLTSINRGVLQGLQDFKYLSLTGIVEALGKLLFGVIFVLIGWDVYGAIGAVVVSSVIGYGYSFYPLNKNLKHVNIDSGVDRKELLDLIKYSWPVFLSLLSITLFLSLDVVLVKHYFSPEMAGSYGGVAILGRAIFFVTAPLVSVLFSVSAKQYKDGENYLQSFLMSFGLIALMGFGAVAIYFIFPKLVILALLGEKFLYIAPYLGKYAIAMTLLSLINLTINFLLSIKITKSIYWVFGGVALQFLGIMIWHENIDQVIFITNAVLLMVLAVVYRQVYKMKK